MKVAVVTGICVERDAISSAAVNRARTLRELPGVSDVTMFAHAFGRETGVRSVGVTDSWQLLRALERSDPDLVIFHWGIRYDLFNVLPLVAAQRRAVVQFHNITPAHLMPEARRAVIDESLRQIELPAWTGTPVWADSPHNRDVLVSWGHPADSVRIVPLAVERNRPRLRNPSQRDRARLLTVGRLVKAKGVDVLVEAMTAVVAELPQRVSLVLAGSSELSDIDFVEELRDSVRRRRLGRSIAFREDLDDSALDREYARADILVTPSLHEGLCVPVIEAYQAGLRVVGTNAGNLPYVIQPPDPVVPPGDSAALAEAIVSVATEVLENRSRTPPGAADLVRRHSPDGVRAEVIVALRELGFEVGG